jgi:glucose/arabinose dehydrogenase
MAHRRARRFALALASVVGLSLAFAGPIDAHAPSVSVVARHLDNPRGVAVGPGGRVFVAVAGRGGPAPTGYGLTGRIAVLAGGHVRTYKGALPSIISDEGASGPVGVSVDRRGHVYGTIGGGPQVLDKRFGTVMAFRPHRGRSVADIAAYQVTDPDPTDLDQPPNPTDSNPYGIAALGWGRELVTDAGGNDLLLVRGHHVVTVARFPNEVISTDFLPPIFGVPPGLQLPAEAVPTSVAVGPDGYWYVGELKGFPFTPGTSRIWRVAPWARNVTCDPTATHGPCTLYMDGFSSIVGLAWGHDRSLYVVEMVKNGVAGYFAGTDTVGALWKVKHGIKKELVPGRLTLPGGVAVARNGTIYVTNESVSVGGGQVLRIRP